MLRWHRPAIHLPITGIFCLALSAAASGRGMLQNLFLCKGSSEGEHGSDTSSLFDLQHTWLPLRGLAHNNGASFEYLLSHCAEADRCLQAQLMPVGNPEPTNYGVGGPEIPPRY